ncbi:carboxypeptidase S [Auricularia subglabra TFB-10046 SS5]|nr:carboxypeptidase S [Auricularia subglabra TFB-10046 SS5]
MGTSKEELPIPTNAPPQARRSSLRAVLLGVVALALTIASFVQFDDDSVPHKHKDHNATFSTGAACKQADPLVPSSKLRGDLDDLYASSPFLTQAAEWLGGAVRVPTESYDVMDPPGQDPRWNVFYDLHDYLEKQFPNVHAKFTLTKVNKIALVYTWIGTDPSLKPLFLAAHQDVVPVEPNTVGQWKQPPYSGLFDGEWIWGRGSCDDKSGLIGTMIALESLITKGFVPRRTIILGFGFDEETGGKEGAQAIGDYLYANYGDEAFSLIVDEGGGYGEQNGIVVAAPAVAEKGYLDVHVQVDTLGGHSSVPPAHTGIGILAAFLAEIEKHPMEPKLTRDSTTYESLQCLAEHAPDLSKSLRKKIKKSAKSDKALKKVAEKYLVTPQLRSLTSTTQAIDLIQGGVKVNALPEQAWAVINHRIATHSSVPELQDRLIKLAAPVTRQFNVSLVAFGKKIGCQHAARAGTLTLSEAWNSALAPAPRTPTDDNAAPYKLLSGTIRAAFRASTSYQGEDIIVAPGMSTGNTDTKRYWKLSKHIFRYNHRGAGDGYNGAHTVNEALRAKSFPDIVRFFAYLILNADESDSIDN